MSVTTDSYSQTTTTTTPIQINYYNLYIDDDHGDDLKCNNNNNHNNNIIYRFMLKRFPDYNKEEKKENNEEIKDEDELYKKQIIMYDYANSLINGNNINEKKLAISKFEKCLEIIYRLYRYNINNNINDKLSLLLTSHMNILLNLGFLNIIINELGLALKHYEEAQFLYELDCSGFNNNSTTKQNLKSYILRSMADVYIKQEEYVSGLGLLEEALNVDSCDKLSIYEIYITQGKALFNAGQLDKSSLIFEKAILLLTNELQLNSIKYNKLTYDSYDYDLYTNTALCYSKIAHSFCSIVYISSTKTYAIKNTKKSIIYWNKSENYYKKSVEISKAIWGKYSIQYIQSLYHWSDCLCTKGHYVQSYHIYQNIYKLYNEINCNHSNHSNDSNHSNQRFEQIIVKTKQMLQTLRPYIVNVNV